MYDLRNCNSFEVNAMITKITNVDMLIKQGSEPVDDSIKSHSITAVEGVGDGYPMEDEPPKSSAASPASENVAGSG